MSKNFTNISYTVQNRAKIDPSDTPTLNLILLDVNDACSIVASKRNWTELYQTGTIPLALADGDTNYPLASNVERVETMAITSPTNNAIQLTNVSRLNILNMVVGKPIGGTGQPTAWYYQPESVSPDNVATKNVSFNVMPDKSYTIEYWYRAFPPLITIGSNFPWFNGNFHWIIDNYCLWKYSERNPDPTLNPDYFRGEWDSGLAQLLESVSDDLMMSLPIAGPNPNANSQFQVPPIL